jgi:V-type H+-transporting ATPase subunit d
MSSQSAEKESLESKREMYETMGMMRHEGPIGGLWTFNAEYGYLEAVLRGFRSGFLKDFEYRQIQQCENLEDIKLALGDTDYLNVLQQQQILTPDIMVNKCRDKYVAEFKYLQSQATGALSTFLEFITYEHLIKSISFVISSLIKGSDVETLLPKCHPLGRSPHLKQIMTFENFENADGLVELYRTVLVDTPVAGYFEKYFNSELKSEEKKDVHDIQKVYNEVEIDIITNMIEKLWLEDFYAYTQSLGGETALIMKELLEFEADKRAINITLNSFMSNLNDPQHRATRQSLYCSFGTLYPDATMKEFSTVSNMQALAQKLEPYPVFRELLRRGQDPGTSFQDQLLAHEVKLNRAAFDGQSHFAAFYAFTKLKAQEERNLRHIFNCIHQRREAKDIRWINIFTHKA